MPIHHRPDEPCCGACDAAAQVAEGRVLVSDRGPALRAHPGQTVELRALDDPNMRLVVPKATATIGRSRTADIVLDSHKLSREQCVLRAGSDEVSVEDLGSGCGTFVNGKKVKRSALHENDVLLLADFRFRVVVT